jgi:hypothetical protein
VSVAEHGAGAAPPPREPGAFRIDRDGAWRHENVEVTHPGVLQNLYANLRAEGDRYHLQVGPWRVPVEVEDVPFVIARAEVTRDGRTIEAYLSDGTREPLDAATLALTPRGVPYCRVKSGQFRARLSVPAWLQLAERIEVDPESGESTLILGDQRTPLRQTE